MGDPVTWNKALEKKVPEVGHLGVEGKEVGWILTSASPRGRL